MIVPHRKRNRTRNRKYVRKQSFLVNSITDYSIKLDDMDSLISSMSQSGGFESRNLANGVNILWSMQNDSKCTRFLSFVGSIISTGVRGIIRDMLKNKMFDCVITTCGALDHDIARANDAYYAGEFGIDDNILLNNKIHRLGNVLIPNENYGPLIEKKVQQCLLSLYNKSNVKEFSSSEIAKHIGTKMNESSFLYWASRNDIPVIVPGILDGAVGSQIWLFYQNHRDFKLNLLADQSRLSDIIYDAKKTGAFMIGGGISKHHTLWWNQFRGGLDYALYITTANEWDGSLSGALVTEAISWGKVKAKAKQVTIHGEATILLPFIYRAMLGRKDMNSYS
ncbi:MAG: deoxyhypusine synthase [Nitrososphaeraceae archaeon]